MGDASRAPHAASLRRAHTLEGRRSRRGGRCGLISPAVPSVASRGGRLCRQSRVELLRRGRLEELTDELRAAGRSESRIGTRPERSVSKEA